MCKPTSSIQVVVILCTFAQAILMVRGHGRLTDPPSRASMWRYGYNNPPDYNDAQGFCGGFAGYVAAGFRCGICGDDFADPHPRAHEVGGTFGNNVIVRQWTKGQVINVQVELTANHLGYFQFKVCPRNVSAVEATEKCLTSNTLELADQSGINRYHVPNSKPDTYSIQLRLPSHLTCSLCTFQWTYTTGNSWGVCDDGTGKLGCGPQETFRACADVTIG